MYALPQIPKQSLHYFEAILRHIISFLFFWIKVSLCSLGWLQTYDLPSAFFQVLSGTRVF